MASVAGAIGAVAVAALTVLWLTFAPDRVFEESATEPSAPTVTITSSVQAPSPAPRPRRAIQPKVRMKPTTPAPLGDVRDLAAGMFCRDLNARGYSYAAAVDYWRVHGQPNQMDEDRNGVPCETVYPAEDVLAYWGDEYPREGLPDNLFCRDLFAMGASYPEAVDYWITHGAPDRMDADLNGIPCETVYPASDVYDYLY